MGDRVWPLVSAATMRALDRHTIDALGIPGELLMECAGRAVAAAVLRQPARPGPVWILCGAGNNGGDGFVAARHLHLQGVEVRVVSDAAPERLPTDAGANLERARAVGVPVGSGPIAAGPEAVLVDALFGTGLARPLEGAPADRVDELNRLRARGDGTRVLAVDLPSGLDADTGQVLGRAVRADTTLSLGLPKLGLTLEPGRDLAGDVRVARIGIADSAPGVSHDAELWTRAAVGARLPERPRDGHKGRFGHVLVVAGSEGKSGAAALCARGAARSGAGLVTVACARSLNPVLESLCTEAMTAPVPEIAGQALGLEAEKTLLELASARDVLALGPGLGRAEETAELVRRLAAGIATPLVIDADALLAFADGPEALAARNGTTVLTPHPGEAGALLERGADRVNADRVGAARELAMRTGAIVVLKGRSTVIAAPEGRLAVNPSGGPALASGGTGDVLTGILAGLLAQELPDFEAATVGTFVHGRSADRWSAGAGEAGLLAAELADGVPATLAELGRDVGRGRGWRAGDAVSFPEPG